MLAVGLLWALALTAAVSFGAESNNPSSIEGVWRSPGGNSIMEVANCGDSPCGTVVWASDRAKTDSSKTIAELVGTKLLTDLEPAKDGSWRGKLFIPDKNMRVIAKIRRISDQELKVSGCAIVCRSAIWTAFLQPLPQDTTKPAPK